MKKIRVLGVAFAISLFSSSAWADPLDALLRDLLVEACGKQMKSATFKRKLAYDRGDDWMKLEGLIRISAAGKTVDSRIFFAFKQADAFEPDVWRLWRNFGVATGFMNETDLRDAFGCNGRVRSEFDIDFYDRKMKLNFR